MRNEPLPIWFVTWVTHSQFSSLVGVSHAPFAVTLTVEYCGLWPGLHVDLLSESVAFVPACDTVINRVILPAVTRIVPLLSVGELFAVALSRNELAVTSLTDSQFAPSPTTAFHDTPSVITVTGLLFDAAGVGFHAFADKSRYAVRPNCTI
jgi:hypothetical protein